MLADIDTAHPKLMPDLTASLDVELSRIPAAIVVPRDAVRTDGAKHLVRVRQGNGFQDREVTLGEISAHEAVVTSGLEEGAVVERNILRQVSR